ncbi:MAG: NACHT domain-containing protein, partial [Chloroflexaceae bacterium]|nr:NACHT domain-containing protein [Chloroflexaceae bacterium]
TRDYVPLQVRAHPEAVPEPVFAALAGPIAGQRPAGLLLIGDAGSGKSHTLRYAALLLAQAWPDVAPELQADLGLVSDKPLLPVYVQLQDLPHCRAELCQSEPATEPTLPRLIDRHLCRLAGDTEHWRADLMRALVAQKAHRCLFLLDGLDEIDEAVERQDFQRALLKLQDEHPEHVYVVTSRPLPDHLLKGFAKRHLLPLRPQQIRRILINWHRAEYDAESLTPEVVRQVERESDDLLATILKDQDLEPMAKNPLFLTAMARMALSDLRLPRLRVEKYRRMVDLLLEWRRNRLRREEGADPFPEASHRAALGRLAELAACMLALGREELALEAFVSRRGACANVLPPRDPEDAPDADTLERLFRSVARHTGLLTEQRGRYRFTFRFRDYLAARAHTQFDDIVERLFARRAEPAWRATIVLAVGDMATINPEILKPLFARLLDEGAESALLAAEALIEALDGLVPELEPERRQVLARLRELGAAPELIQRLEPLEIADNR